MSSRWWTLPTSSRTCCVSYGEDVCLALAHLVTHLADDATCYEWGEVNDRKYLFRASQTWTQGQASAFVVAASYYLGFA